MDLHVDDDEGNASDHAGTSPPVQTPKRAKTKSDVLSAKAKEEAKQASEALAKSITRARSAAEKAKARAKGKASPKPKAGTSKAKAKAASTSTKRAKTAEIKDIE